MICRYLMYRMSKQSVIADVKKSIDADRGLIKKSKKEMENKNGNVDRD